MLYNNFLTAVLHRGKTINQENAAHLVAAGGATGYAGLQVGEYKVSF